MTATGNSMAYFPIIYFANYASSKQAIQVSFEDIVTFWRDLLHEILYNY